MTLDEGQAHCELRSTGRCCRGSASECTSRPLDSSAPFHADLLRTRTLGTVGALLAVTVAIKTWVRLLPGAAVQAVLNDYVPGLALGGFVPVGSPQ